ncbi:hypothetical protein [Brevibacillus laterosporus]|uniref:hypothetical protein n=1 Tax=Brevibacillus laterosporus TaxID=1465 RepID=UPI00264C309D|nr:hypothetical protein [Brevibacillus laterosporus]MDN9012438.1 hypothetical protein [Brevibacillus laterosporus]MDO0943499.1 hypothetical protein [Brevibacillus laterosporus]
MEDINTIDQTNYENFNAILLNHDELMLLRTILQEKTPQAQYACSLLKDIANKKQPLL